MTGFGSDEEKKARDAVPLYRAIERIIWQDPDAVPAEVGAWLRRQNPIELRRMTVLLVEDDMPHGAEEKT